MTSLLTIGWFITDFGRSVKISLLPADHWLIYNWLKLISVGQSKLACSLLTWGWCKLISTNQQIGFFLMKAKAPGSIDFPKILCPQQKLNLHQIDPPSPIATACIPAAWAQLPHPSRVISLVHCTHLQQVKTMFRISVIDGWFRLDWLLLLPA